MTGSSDARALRALALAALTVPPVLLAHLAVAGTPPTLAGALAVTVVALLAGALVPTRSLGLGSVLAGGALLAGDLALMLLPAGSAGCLPATVRGAELGVRIGLLGEPGCPPGTFAGGTLTRAALAALVTAAVLVAGHLLVAVAGAWLLEGTRRAAESCAGLVRALAALLGRALPALPRIPVAVRLPDRPRDVALPVLSAPVPGPLTHRGPPLLARV